MAISLSTWPNSPLVWYRAQSELLFTCLQVHLLSHSLVSYIPVWFWQSHASKSKLLFTELLSSSQMTFVSRTPFLSSKNKLWHKRCYFLKPCASQEPKSPFTMAIGHKRSWGLWHLQRPGPSADVAKSSLEEILLQDLGVFKFTLENSHSSSQN